MFTKQKLALFAVILCITAQTAANTLDVRTPAPVIHLAENLDEKDNLGWCIDTLGRGFAERLQAHSCKPQGGDVQFSFDNSTGQIQSVEYTSFCMANRPKADSTFTLVECDATAEDQQFVYSTEDQTLSPKTDQGVCVSVGAVSRSAGPFMSRVLLLTRCTETDSSLKTWVIVPG